MATARQYLDGPKQDRPDRTGRANGAAHGRRQTDLAAAGKGAAEGLERRTRRRTGKLPRPYRPQHQQGRLLPVAGSHQIDRPRIERPGLRFRQARPGRGPDTDTEGGGPSSTATLQTRSRPPFPSAPPAELIAPRSSPQGPARAPGRASGVSSVPSSPVPCRRFAGKPFPAKNGPACGRRR